MPQKAKKMTEVQNMEYASSHWYVVSGFCTRKRGESADRLVQSLRIYMYTLFSSISCHFGDLNYAADRPRRLSPELVPFGGGSDGVLMKKNCFQGDVVRVLGTWRPTPTYSHGWDSSGR